MPRSHECCVTFRALQNKNTQRLKRLKHKQQGQGLMLKKSQQDMDVKKHFTRLFFHQAETLVFGPGTRPSELAGGEGVGPPAELVQKCLLGAQEHGGFLSGREAESRVFFFFFGGGGVVMFFLPLWGSTPMKRAVDPIWMMNILRQIKVVILTPIVLMVV